MKMIIWVLTFLIGSVVNALIGDAIGIRAGAFLLYLVEYRIGKALCDAWDKSRMEKQPDERTMTPPEDLPVTERETAEEEVRDTGNICPYCGAPVLPDSIFCSSCGRKVESDVPE